MSIPDKTSRFDEPINSYAPPTIGDLLESIRSQWAGTFCENACTLHRSAFTGRWTRQDSAFGNRSSVRLDIKAILKTIITQDSDAIILYHSHVHFNAHPSQSDLRTTKEIARLCRTLDVQFLDHVIFAKDACFSFRKHGYL